MARPTGSTAEVHKVRRDYRFAPETMEQIAGGMAVFGGSLKETAFVERAIAHYAEFLAGDPVSQGQLTQEMERLQEQVRELHASQDMTQRNAHLEVALREMERQKGQALERIREVEDQLRRSQAHARALEGNVRTTQSTLRSTQIALRLAEEKPTSGPAPEKRVRRKQPPSSEPQITIDSLELKGTMGGYWLQWEQDGLCMNVGLEAIDDHSSLYGYHLEWYGSNPARRGGVLTERQQQQVFRFIAPARARLVEELFKAGWWPKDPTKPEDQATIWMPPRKGEKPKESP